MLTDLYTQRALIWAFANRDFATRYRSSILGWAWSLIQPLATLIVFAAVFSIVFRIEAPPLGNGNGSSYAAFLFTGLVTWNLFSSLLNLSMTQLKSNGELLKKVQFPAWTPILGASIVQLIQVLLELARPHRDVPVPAQRGLDVDPGPADPRWAPCCSPRASDSCCRSSTRASATCMYIVAVVLGALYFLTPGALPDQHDRRARTSCSAGSSSSTR